MKKKINREKGITLIALVITIIILLILAGISISALTNQGLFKNAKTAQSKTEEANAKEKMRLLEQEWQIESVTSGEKTLETFLNEKETEKSIDGYKKLEDGNYEVYVNEYVGKLDKDGNLIGEVEKAGPRPTVSNITIKSEDGKTEIADHSQKTGTKLQINFNTGIENGTIKSVTPAVPYTTNGTETEVTFTIIGTVEGTEYKTTKKISIGSKYKVSEPVDASAIAKATDTEKATNYYGKTVTGYTPVNGTTVGWKIFYADESNIYLIADDYVEPEKLPASTTASGEVTTNKPNITGSSYPKGAYFTNILNDYSTGSARVTDEKIKALNNSFFSQNLTSTNSNMKAVAYMLDTKAWETFKDSANNDTSKAEYVIGGPTVEMLFKSYNQKHPGKNYEAKATSATGYQIRVNEGTWKYYTNSSSDYLNTDDTLYVLPSSKGANAMWLASPSAGTTNYVVSVDSDGSVYCNYYDYTYIGFRPLVCLKSGIKLQESGAEFKIVE